VDVLVQVGEDHRGDRQDDALGREPGRREHLVDQVAVKPAVRVHERVDEVETEGNARSGHHGIDAVRARTDRLGQRDEPVHQVRHVLRTGRHVPNSGIDPVAVVVPAEQAIAGAGQDGRGGTS
jgi:hypothetical protein